jgi:hypothetical protein
VVTVVTPDQRKDVNAMTRSAGIRPIVTQAVHAAHPLLEDLAGPAEPARKVTHAQMQPMAERGAPGGRQGQRAGAHRQGQGQGQRSGQAARPGQGQSQRSGASRSGAPRSAVATTDAGRPARVTQDGRPATRPSTSPRGRGRRAPAGR